MATYVPDPTDSSQPTEDKFVESAAAEFRALKGRVNDLETADNTEDLRNLRVPFGELIPALPDALSRASTQLLFNAAGDPIVGQVDAGTAVGVLLQLADSVNPAMGDALVAVRQPLAGAVGRTQHQKNSDRLSVKDFGAIGDGIADDTTAFQVAASFGRGIFMPAGNYKLNDSITCIGSAYFYGDGGSTVLIQHAAVPVFILPISNGRDQKHFRDFQIRGNGNVLAGTVLIRFPGTPSGQSVVYTSGYTFSNLTFGNGELIGGGFFLSDTFRCSIVDVGMTNVAIPVEAFGNVCQSSVERVISNNDAANATVPNHIGVYMHAKNTYLDGLSRVPENFQVHLCGFVGYNVGASATGLLITVKDNDFDFCKTIGIQWVGGDACVIEGNWVASAATADGFIGILARNTANKQEPVHIIGNRIYSYSVLPGFSCGVQYGDGFQTPFSAPSGAVIERNHVFGVAGSWQVGIDLDRNHRVACSYNSVAPGVTRGNAIRATNQEDSTLISNDLGTGELHLESPVAAGKGVVLQNTCTFTTAFITTPANWLIHQK